MTEKEVENSTTINSILSQTRRKYLSSIVAGIGFTTGCLGQNERDDSTTQPSTTYSCDTDTGITTDSLPHPTLGNSEAQVTVDVFEDFSCPGCKRFHLNILPKIYTEYIDSDATVRLRRFDYPLPIHEWAKPVANAARRVQQLQGDVAFFEYSEWLYANQSEYSWEMIGDIVEDSPVEVEPCEVITAAYNESYSSVIESNIKRGDEVGVSATPTVLIDGDPVEQPPSFEKISGIIDSKLS